MKYIKKINVTVLSLCLSCLFLSLVYSYDKTVVVSVDGEKINYKTSFFTVDFLVNEVVNEHNISEYKYDTDSEEKFVSHNDNIEISSKKNINVTVGNETVEVETYADTVDELIKELDLKNEEDDNVEYVPTKFNLLKDISSLNLIKVRTELVTVKETKQPEIINIEDDELLKGLKIVIDKGSLSEYSSDYKVVYYNGIEYYRQLLDRELLKEGSPKKIRVGTKEIPKIPANFENGDTVWDSIASCEAGGNWATNTSNGYYGGLQFSAASWNTASNAVGVDAEFAHLASREDQIKAAEWMLSKSSWKQQWPSCSKKLGLW
ncbi:MAG: transglycosylase family protein [Bacilli bacterium]